MFSSSILDHMIKAVQLGGQVLESYFRRPDLEVRQKPGAGLVTPADVACEQTIREYLEKNGFGDFDFVGEETRSLFDQVLRSDKPIWILDPLDGTTNFIFGWEFWAISLALVYQGQVQAGVIWAPLWGKTGTLYSAMRFQGAYANGQLLRVKKEVSLRQSLLATGFFHEDPQRVEIQVQQLRRVLDRVQGIRRLGSAALDLAWVAEGRFHGFWEQGLHPWDVAAGILLVEEAGGVVLNHQGQPYRLGDEWLVAGSFGLAQELWETLFAR